jgi:hypothetical protein
MNLRILFLVAIVVAGCSAPFDEGKIVKKIYEPETQYMTMIFVPTSTGKTTILMPIPFWVYDGEDFIIKVEGYDKKKNKVAYVKKYISKEMYSSHEIGDVVCVKDCPEQDTNNRKEERR